MFLYVPEWSRERDNPANRMNGKLIVLLGEAVVNLAVPAKISVFGGYPEYTPMQRRILRDGCLVLGRIEQRIEIVRVEYRHHHRRVRLEDDRFVLTVPLGRGRTYLQHVTILTFAIEHVYVTGSSPNQ